MTVRPRASEVIKLASPVNWSSCADGVGGLSIRCAPRVCFSFILRGLATAIKPPVYGTGKDTLVGRYAHEDSIIGRGRSNGTLFCRARTKPFPLDCSLWCRAFQRKTLRGRSERICSLAHLNRYPFHFRHFLYRPAPSFATASRILHTAEGYGGLVVNCRPVDVHHSCLKLQRKTHCELQIIGDHRGRKAIYGIVGQSERMIRISRTANGSDRSKKFVAECGHFGRYVSEHGWVEKISFVVANG